MLKILIFPPSFKISFRAKVLLWPRHAHSIRCNFTNKMSGKEPDGLIDTASYYGIRGVEGPEFIRCMDRRKSQVHEVLTFGEYGITHEIHLAVQVDVGTRFVR